jgi:site-specific recombinase XerD
MDQHLTLEQTLDAFIVALADKNRSRATRKAYRLDLQHFITYLHATKLTISHPVDVKPADITEYLSFLTQQQLSGATRARKVAALRRILPLSGCAWHSCAITLDGSGDTSNPFARIRMRTTNRQLVPYRLLIATS